MVWPDIPKIWFISVILVLPFFYILLYYFSLIQKEFFSQQDKGTNRIFFGAGTLTIVSDEALTKIKLQQHDRRNSFKKLPYYSIKINFSKAVPQILTLSNLGDSIPLSKAGGGGGESDWA